MSTDLISSVLLGLSLSAACGLRALVPPLIFSICVFSGFLLPESAFGWIGSPATLSVLALGACAEMAASFTAAGDRFLDLVETPAAMLIASLLVMATLPYTNVVLGIVLPLVVGAGVAGLSQSITGLMHARTAARSGARGKRAAAGIEAAGSITLAALGVLVPVAGGVLVMVLLGARWKDAREAVRR